MSTKAREVILGGRGMAAKMRAETARQGARRGGRATDQAEAEAWSINLLTITVDDTNNRPFAESTVPTVKNCWY